MKLIPLTINYQSQLIEMIQEWKHDIQINQTNSSPATIFRHDPNDFDTYISDLETKEPQNNYVKDSVLFLLDETEDKLLGAVNIRHELNEVLLNSGGHIGLGIRPSERKKGFGSELLRLSLLKCKELNIHKVLITCDQTNLASKKNIIKHGGKEDIPFVNIKGETILRYWISLD